MSARRSGSRLRIALVVAAVAIGVCISSRPLAGQQGGGASRVPVTAQVPSIPVPSIAVPRTPAQGGSPQPAQPAKSLDPQRLEALALAAKMGVNYLPGEVIVKFRPDAAKAEQNRALAAIASQPTTDTIEWHSSFAIVHDASQPNAYILADQLKAQPEVEYAEPNFFVTIDPYERAATAPTPTVSIPSRTTVPRTGARINGVPADPDYSAFQWNFSLLNMPAAWDLQPGGSSDLIVAVIDTGITTAAASLVYPIWTGSSFQTLTMPAAVNPDLPAGRLTQPKDFIGARVSPAVPLADLDGHGTHVSGTIAEAANNNFLVAGMAYNVKVMPVKVCSQYWDLMISRGVVGTPGFSSLVNGTCAFADIADGITYAVDHGARVLNISLGGDSPSTTLLNALQYAASHGAFVAVSMGNAFLDGNPVQYPAAYAPSIDGVMSVAAINANSNHASYSSTGSYAEVAAPGGDIDNSRADFGAIWQSTLRPSTVDPTRGVLVPRFDSYDKVGYTGTSMASPHVAALAALIMSQQPNLTGAQVEQIIRNAVKDLGTAGKDNQFGYGLIQPREALYGHSIHR